MFINKRPVATPETIADGEYTAQVVRLRMTKDESSVMFICKITSPGFEQENLEVVGYARASWNKPTGRTTANLYQWVKNLGGNLIDGQEDMFDLETLKGANCRVIVQSYVGKSDGVPRVKVSNILPFDKRPIPNPMASQRQGMHVQSAPAPAAAPAQPVMQSRPEPAQPAPAQQPATSAPTGVSHTGPGSNGSEDSKNLW